MCERSENSKTCGLHKSIPSESELIILKEKLDELDNRPLKIQKELLDKLRYLDHEP